ncbi:cobalt-precorrin-8X methylmutase [[Clostridium] sordellii]|uniref:Cobalt-precorrin-8X methylmutase (Cobalt-precorrin isomerase) (HBA synthase) n=2 Tax=Clostridia TaxID=186801 RepID=A0ABM9RTE9_PARSO|nr:cobalt-precorrin-8 methylmutase [Paeniclostridium sordellii]CEJ75372.1 Cobalt-precorrin-8X methylmutase (Cobalt-precorrin isomerase) (HBA synthase) [[Clostridium] sordellii] [Paeniclostridium sordellii]CEN68033.1 cobalt-precorrin-8X methylmutase [[Clostridium] sordellii] [Paeniclostridium sordellii]CEN73108.1 cobalt-precorrin-8X methylmutase [[Clostridium] sordellii] [Paeniclostridium sordellii]CEO20911.1 cobalt-precorrin-8X methylmutase [[Clostridium] sordellii] [Paeniclostridium sordellii]
MEYIKNPMMIESKSFEIIQGIIDEIRPDYKFKNEIEEKIIKRAIHTTADFEYLDILKISEEAVEKLVNGLKNKATIYTDTNMALSGINKRKLEALGCKYKCFVSDEEVAKLAKEKGITRSMAAVEVASREEGKKIFVLGNAPTALYKVIEMSNNGQLDVEAVVGVPVGFVGAEESKDELAKTDIPYIISKGRKGGSNLAAAIINAILYSL